MTEKNRNASRSKGERTIRSETTKIFLVIFAILVTLGLFTIFSTWNGARKFDSIKTVYLPQFQATELMKQQAMDIIAIFYLLAGDQNQDIQMEQMLRYDGLVADFMRSHKAFEDLVKQKAESSEQLKMIALLVKTRTVFDLLNSNCQKMILNMMEDRKEQAKKDFANIYSGIAEFKKSLEDLELIVNTQLAVETDQAQSLLRTSSYIGVTLTVLATFVTIALIYYLIRFLSISLLPISNLMHNLRQAVFSIDKSYKIISPVSKYSSAVFDEEIVGRSIFETVFKDLDQKSEALSCANTALISVFGEDDVQWMLQEDSLPQQVRRTMNDGRERILKITYTPLWNEQRLVQNIMVVAEDVTEIESLRAQALQKQDEVAIIQALISIERGDLEAYLSRTRSSIQECLDVIGVIHENSEACMLVLRNLHTMKGNARLYNLRKISELAHSTENILVDMNTRSKEKDRIPSEMVTELNDSILKLGHILEVHSRTAQQLFGVHNLERAIEVPTSKINLIRSLVAEIRQNPEDKTAEKLDELNEIISKIIDYPLQQLFHKIEPMVHDISERLMKSVRYKISGDDVTLNRERAFALRDIVVHLVRNALDHGIESTVERNQAGKPVQATLEVSCQLVNGNIDITVKDDGRGISTEKLMLKAVEMGVLSDREAQQLSHEDKLSLVFVPHLSTRKEASALSGRGVGMDIVKATVLELGGKVTVASHAGSGAEFHLILPREIKDGELKRSIAA